MNEHLSAVVTRARPIALGLVATLAMTLAMPYALAPAAVSRTLAVPVAAPAPTPASNGFLWGAATSSYQVEGGIQCPPWPGPGTPWAPTPIPCDDYDFFNSNFNIQQRVLANAGILISPAGINADRAFQPAYYKQDFDNARMLGLNALRISLEWGRIQPEPPTLPNGDPNPNSFDQNAINGYKAMLDAMIARGLRPIVSLNHFTLPTWVLTPPAANQCIPGPTGTIICHAVPDTGYGSSLKGWESSDTVAAYVNFVKRIVPELKSRVDYWLTVNEPVGSQVVVGYIAGIWPPGFVIDGGRAKAALHNLIQAHVSAYDVITTCSATNTSCDDVDADGDGVAKHVGFAHAMGATIGAKAGFLGDQTKNNIAASNFTYFVNDYFIQAVVTGEEDTHYLDDINQPRHLNPIMHPDWAGHLDFLGVNYYRRFHVYHDPLLDLVVPGLGFIGGNNHNNLYGEPDDRGILNDLGWEIYPQGLHDVIMQVKNSWNLPVLITENGTPERADRNRAPHVVAHLREVQKAIDDGATVLGFMHWSLLDNWELQEGYRANSQFGLFHVDRSEVDANGSLVLHRAMTEGALAYQQVIFESRAANGSGLPTGAALDSAERKFGTIASDGSKVVPPTKTHGRFWEGKLADGTSVSVYLGYTGVDGKLFGLLFRKNDRVWHNFDVRRDAQGFFFHESWFDDATNAVATADHRVSYASDVWTFSSASGSNTASRITGTGLWQWTSGTSPWGGEYFYVTKLEGGYAGKFLTFFAPGPADVPGCGTAGCVPGNAGPVWRELSSVQLGSDLELVAKDLSDSLELFDVFLTLSGDTATTDSVNSGAFKVTRATNLSGAPFGLTGYAAPFGDVTWRGQRDETTDSKFHFLEGRGLFRVFPANPPAQYEKEHDPTSVVPLDNFTFTVLSATTRRVSFEAGGRAYTLTSGLDVCAPIVCPGTWSDIAGKAANRVPEQFPPFPDAGGDRTVEANAKGGANVQLNAGGSLDIEGDPLTYSWTGDFGTASGASPTVFLTLGAHTVCVNVTDGKADPTACAQVTVADTTPPAVAITAPPDGSSIQDGVTFSGMATDVASAVASVTLSVRDGSSNPIGLENLATTYDTTTGAWSLAFNTRPLADGVYVAIARATDSFSNVGQATATYRVRNWVMTPIPPSSQKINAGRTVALKFTLRVDAAVDATRPFVYREDLNVRVSSVAAPAATVFLAVFGTGARDYRIDSSSETYITNFDTPSTPTTYLVEVRRGSFVIGSFSFATQ